VAGNRSETGYPWLGGFPQTGIQTPSIMHFAENRSDEGIAAVGMEFAGGPYVLIGHTDNVAYTTTTALLRTVDTFFESIINENGDIPRYSDEGTPAALVPRIEIFRVNPVVRRTMWRSHERAGNGGSRPVLDFIGDTHGVASGGTSMTLDAAGAFDSSFAGGYIAIVSGTAAGEIRHIAAVVGNDRVEVDAAAPWTVAPAADSEFVAVRPGKQIIAVATDSALWLEETTAVLGFSLYQRATDVLGIKRGARVIPSTHNFIAADNQPFNGIGSANGNGNIGYWASGFSRIRTDGTDVRLPIDGSKPNPLVVAHGTVASAAATALTATSAAFSGLDLGPLPVNFRYSNPSEQGREYIVAITGGSGYKQTRRVAGNDAGSLTIEYPWGVVPSAGDTFEVYPIVGMPEAINPLEGYMANWNNKAATADDGNNFGRLWRHIFILERLATESETAAWNRTRQRQLNDDVAGLDGKGDLGRFLLPRIREAVDGIGNGGTAAVDTVLAQLEAHQAGPDLGRFFNDPVQDTKVAGEVAFMNTLINNLSQAIYGDELGGAVNVPTGSRALSMVQHAIDSAAGDLPGGYQQAFSGNYFDGPDWRIVVRDTFAALAATGIPADTDRPRSRYRHPLAALLPALEFEATPQGNRGTYEQIVDVSPLIKGEFIFPLGQSGLIEGSIAEVTSVDPNFTSLQPIWRDWRFVPMLPLARDIAAGGSADSDGDSVPDAYERWYFGDLSRSGDADGDRDGVPLSLEYGLGIDPTAGDTDGDGIRDGFDTAVRDRLGDSRCSGDCDGSLTVTIDELLRAVAITLESQPLEACTAGDFDGDDEIEVAEIIRAVNAALTGCTA
jgi:Penicillin amidase